MEKFKEWLSEVWEEFAPFIICIGVVILIIVLLVTGASIIGTVLTVILLGVAIYLGSLPILASAFVMGVLLKVLSADLHRFANVWSAGPKNDQFFAALDATGYIATVFIFFLAMYAIGYAVRLLNSVIGSFKPIKFEQTVGTPD